MSKSNLQREIKEFDEEFECKKEVCKKNGLGKHYKDQPMDLQKIKQFISELVTRIQIQERKRTLLDLEKEYEEVEKGLDEEYGKGHGYSPNYKGILRDKLELVEK